MTEREFTEQEANELLPALTASLNRIREARQVVLAGAEPIKRSAPQDGWAAGYWEALATLRTEIESITGQGIVLRDPETGLVDFPTRRDGRAAFLCWRMGEDRVGYWHGTQSGFAGRRPL